MQNIRGNNSIISWDCLILDTDFHRIYKDGNMINENKPIEIGNHVWIGAITVLSEKIQAHNKFFL